MTVFGVSAANACFVRSSKVGPGCSERTVWILQDCIPTNVRKRGIRCGAEYSTPHVREVSAQANNEKRMTAMSRTPVVRSGRSECRLLDTQASIRQSRLAWRSGPIPIKTSHQRAQPRRLRVSLFALIAVEPVSTAAQPISGKQLKRRTFSNASRFG